MAHHRSDGAATNHEIARVTAALQHLTVRDDDLAHRSRAPIAVDPTVRRAAARARSDARASLLALASWQPGNLVTDQCIPGRPVMGSDSTVCGV